MIQFTITLKAVSARLTAEVLNFVEGLNADIVFDVTATQTATRTAKAASAKPVHAPKAMHDSEECHFQGPPGWQPRIAPVQPVTAINPFVTQAVESSSMRKRIHAQKAQPSGRNRVIYEVTGTPPEGAVIKGVPAQIMNHLMTYVGSHSMSAKQIEVQLGLKRKSVESALYLLRTLGVVQSIAI